MARIRILRVLEYEGEEQDIWRTFTQGGVPANGEVEHGGMVIRSGLIGHPDYNDWKPISAYINPEKENG